LGEEFEEYDSHAESVDRSARALPGDKDGFSRY
jgi:hypothetical protein